MDLGINNRVALVAAASQGLGYACALELAREGARIFLCSRDQARASDAARKIHEETGATVAGIAADITEERDVQQFVSLARDQAGAIDIVVANCGGPTSGAFSQIDLAEYQKAFELVGMSAIRLAKLTLPAMRERKWGRIINITSISAKQPIEGGLLSNTIRAGLTAWAKTVSNEVASDNVTVNTVAPGYTLTEKQHEHAVTRGQALGKSEDDMIQSWAAQAPINRLADPGEIASAVAFLHRNAPHTLQG
jgi:3-oxoacyl-[acyl-carrier protein] reductase